MPIIGVLITLPEPAASRLDAYRLAIGDPNAQDVPSHITLLPPTEISETALPEVEERLAAAATRHPAFRVHLRGTATFRPVSPVVFVALAEGIAQTELLAEEVRRGPMAVELDHPFHPHVTVAHDVAEDALDRAFDDLADFDCSFDVTDFHLYTQDAEERWHRTRRFDLQEA